MSDAWITIIGLTIGTAVIKAAGPAYVGGRELHPSFARVVALFAPALLAALVIVESFSGGGRSLVVDARAAGLGAALAILVTTESMIWAMVGAAGATALVRLIA